MLVRRLAPATFAVLAVAVVAACGARTNLACTKELTLQKDVPSLYFVLDRSTSMLESGKWDAVRTSVAALIRELGPQARFGAAEFPVPNASDGCMAGAQVLSLRPGDTTGDAARAFLAATADMPDGGTPTAATLTALLPTLAAEAGPTFVILATDGGPNCNDALTCDFSTCTANIDHVSAQCNPGVLPNCCTPDVDGPLDCLDQAATVAAVQALAAASIPVYVIGVPGSAPYAAVLDAVAVAGGTARSAEPLYYAVDTSDEGALESTLDDVARRVNASCFIELLAAPTNPAGLTVSVAGTPTGDFSYDATTRIISIGGTACAAVQTGATVTVSDIDECPVE